MAIDEKTEQLEKLIAKIETRFQGKFITEEQWKFVLDRLTALEKIVSAKKVHPTSQETIFSLFLDGSEFSKKEVCQLTELSIATVTRILSRLNKKGLLSRRVVLKEAIFFLKDGTNHE